MRLCLHFCSVGLCVDVGCMSFCHLDLSLSFGYFNLGDLWMSPRLHLIYLDFRMSAKWLHRLRWITSELRHLSSGRCTLVKIGSLLWSCLLRRYLLGLLLILNSLMNLLAYNLIEHSFNRGLWRVLMLVNRRLNLLIFNLYTHWRSKVQTLHWYMGLLVRI